MNCLESTINYSTSNMNYSEYSVNYFEYSMDSDVIMHSTHIAV